jgi:hypothetical protein
MTQKTESSKDLAWSGLACSIPLEEPDSLQAPSFSYGVPDRCAIPVVFATKGISSGAIGGTQQKQFPKCLCPGSATNFTLKAGCPGTG